MLEGIFDLIRPVVSSILINCPDERRLLGSLQKYLGYEETIYIGDNGGYDRKITGILWYRRPSGDRKWRKMWDDNFSCYVPVWVYNKYIETRKNYIKVIRTKLRERRDKAHKK